MDPEELAKLLSELGTTGKVAKNNDNTIDISVVPIIFLPGVMGTRLQFPDGARWDPDAPGEMLASWVIPAIRTVRERFRNGGATVVTKSPLAVPPIPGSDADEAKAGARGFSSVARDFYLDFLIRLNTALVPVPGGAFPVYAVGYDWTQSNAVSAKQVDAEVTKIIDSWKPLGVKKVVVVTHSMGGLVARAACKLVPGFADKVAGIVHTVQPTVGASITYRRFLTGANDPDKDAFNAILGNEWWKFMALMSVLRGPLELLPTDDYLLSEKDPLPWLLHFHGVHNGGATSVPLATKPIRDQYLKTVFPGLCFNRDASVTGFTAAEWVAVQGELAVNLDLANTFHKVLGLSAHPTTSILASVDSASVEAGVTGIVFDEAPFFSHAVRATAGDQTVPKFSAAILPPTEDGKIVPSPETAKPSRRLVDAVGEHSQVLKNDKAFNFVLDNVKHFIQKAKNP